jgi:hypothetical protein
MDACGMIASKIALRRTLIASAVSRDITGTMSHSGTGLREETCPGDTMAGSDRGTAGRDRRQSSAGRSEPD